MNDFQTNQYPDLQSQVVAAAGFDVPLEVQWETLAAPGESHLYAESWPQVYFEPLIQGLKTVGGDKMGLDAIKAGLKKIVIQNTTGCYYGDRWATLQDGALTLDHEPLTNVALVDDRTKGLVKALEAGL